MFDVIEARKVFEVWKSTIDWRTVRIGIKNMEGRMSKEQMLVTYVGGRDFVGSLLLMQYGLENMMGKLKDELELE